MARLPGRPGTKTSAPVRGPGIIPPAASLRSANGAAGCRGRPLPGVCYPLLRVVPGACAPRVGDAAVAAAHVPVGESAVPHARPRPRRVSPPRPSTTRRCGPDPRAGQRFRTSDRGDDGAVQPPRAAGIAVPAAVPCVAVVAADVPAGFVNPEAPVGRRRAPVGHPHQRPRGAGGVAEGWPRHDGGAGVDGGMRGSPVRPAGQPGLRRDPGGPRPTTHAPGRPQRDVRAGRWLPRLHRYGRRTRAWSGAACSGSAPG